MKENIEKKWVDIINNEFEHPATILWRAVELRYLERAIHKFLPTEPILDLGCAEGKVGGMLFRGKIIYGLDNCWKLIEQNNKGDVYRALVLADASHMPYKNDSFGSAFSNCVVEHIRDLDSVLKETYSILKERGIFLFTVPSHKFADFLFFSIIFANLGLKRPAEWYKTKRNKLLNHFHCYDHNQWADILQKKGFKLIEYAYYMPKKATFIWDFLAIAFFIPMIILPIRIFLVKLNKFLNKFLKIYYDMDSQIGAGLLIVTEKMSVT